MLLNVSGVVQYGVNEKKKFWYCRDLDNLWKAWCFSRKFRMVLYLLLFGPLYYVPALYIPFIWTTKKKC